MPTEFYFEIQYFNSDWKMTVTLNCDKYVSATVGKTPPHRAVQNLKICRRKKSLCAHLNNVALNCTEF